MFIYFHAKLSFISNILQSGHTDLFSYFTNFNDITEYWMDFCCLLKKNPQNLLHEVSLLYALWFALMTTEFPFSSLPLHTLSNYYYLRVLTIYKILYIYRSIFPLRRVLCKDYCLYYYYSYYWLVLFIYKDKKTDTHRDYLILVGLRHKANTSDFEHQVCFIIHTVAGNIKLLTGNALIFLQIMYLFNT